MTQRAKKGGVPFGIVMRRVNRVVNYYLRRCWWAERDDLEQQGWLIALSTIQHYDPTKGDFGRYVFTNVSRSLSDYLRKTGSPVSGGASHLEGLTRHPFPPDDNEAPWHQLPAEMSLPDEELDALRLSGEVRQVIAGVLEEADPELLLGINLLSAGEPPRKCAEKGKKRQNIYRARSRARRELEDNGRLWLAWQGLLGEKMEQCAAE